MKNLMLFCASLLLLATSCNYQSSEKEQLKAQNDSLQFENTKNTEEMNSMLDMLDEVETKFQSIRKAENYLTIEQQEGGEMNPSRRKKFAENMNFIAETLEANKKQIEALNDKLKRSGIQSAALRKTINRLSAQLDEKVSMIAELQEELAKKNIHIDELDSQVTSLKDDVEELSATSLNQKDQLSEQDRTLNTAYYCFGTHQELKAQKIITGGSLFSKTKLLTSGFNKDYFIAIDIRDVKEIPLYDKKAKLISIHPEGSYQLVKDEEENIVLIIKDYNKFWNLSKYLVIEVG